LACVNWDPKKYGMSFDEFTEEVNISKKNSMWIYQMFDRLRTKYQDKWIAVRSTEIIGVSNDQMELIESILKSGIPLEEVEIRYITPRDILQIL